MSDNSDFKVKLVEVKVKCPLCEKIRIEKLPFPQRENFIQRSYCNRCRNIIKSNSSSFEVYSPNYRRKRTLAPDL